MVTSNAINRGQACFRTASIDSRRSTGPMWVRHVSRWIEPETPSGPLSTKGLHVSFLMFHDCCVQYRYARISTIDQNPDMQLGAEIRSYGHADGPRDGSGENRAEAQTAY